MSDPKNTTQNNSTKTTLENIKECVQKVHDDNCMRRRMSTIILTVNCLAGLALSLYSFYVELHLEQDKNYKAYCDIGPSVSCTKAFSSEYGKGMGIFGKDWKYLHKPNSLYGIMFYSMIATLVQSNKKFSMTIAYILVVTSNTASLYFAYILYFVLADLCIVCITIYFINVVNLIFTQMKVKTLWPVWAEMEKKQKKMKKPKRN